LKIALDLQADDILEIMQRANFTISKHELSAFFRKPGHKHYRECQEQILRKFLKGAQLKYRESSEPEGEAEAEGVWKVRPKAKPEPKSKPEAKLKNAAKSRLKSKPAPSPKAKPKPKSKPKLSLKKK
jgi:hypothetical protein